MYKWVKLLSFAPVFYSNTWGFTEHDMGRKKKTAAREAICVNLPSTYPISNMANHLMNTHSVQFSPALYDHYLPVSFILALKSVNSSNSRSSLPYISQNYLTLWALLAF